MTEATSKPEKITKPIQLLAAWLGGLLSINTCFLVAAANMPTASWEASALVVSSIVNVPIFLVAVFLLQTKFRPEMQEDSFYATYLSHKTNQPISVNKDEVMIAQLNQKLSSLEARMAGSTAEVKTTEHSIASLRVGLNEYLSDYEDIGDKLMNFGVGAFKVFKGDSHPAQRVVAISRYLTKGATKDVIDVARDLGFRYYTMFDNRMENTEEDVLFGAYGEPEFTIAGAAVQQG